MAQARLPKDESGTRSVAPGHAGVSFLRTPVNPIEFPDHGRLGFLWEEWLWLQCIGTDSAILWTATDAQHIPSHPLPAPLPGPALTSSPHTQNHTVHPAGSSCTLFAVLEYPTLQPSRPDPSLSPWASPTEKKFKSFGNWNYWLSWKDNQLGCGGDKHTM